MTNYQFMARGTIGHCCRLGFVVLLSAVIFMTFPSAANADSESSTNETLATESSSSESAADGAATTAVSSSEESTVVQSRMYVRERGTVSMNGQTTQLSVQTVIRPTSATYSSGYTISKSTTATSSNSGATSSRIRGRGMVRERR